MELVIVTGLSGSGKSKVVDALEDIGFFCVDNIPPKLILKFAELCSQSAQAMDRVAIVVDARSREMFSTFSESLAELTARGYTYKILYIEAEDSVILKRYKETRRRHPLLDGECDSTEESLKSERELLRFARENADYILDTSLSSTAQLKEKIADLFLSDTSQKLLVSVMSFGFKYGLPAEADLVFDVRCLPNPFYIAELRDRTGLEKSVRDYVFQQPQTGGLVTRLFDLIDYLLPLYREEGKTQLTIAVGCTGGQHRSVALAEHLYRHLEEAGARVICTHRDIHRRQQ